MKTLVLATFLLAATSPGRVSVSVMPTALMAGGTLRLTCTVPKHPDNRWLEMGVENYTSSTTQLDGDSAAITHTMTFQHIPCDSSAVYCVVTDNLGKQYASARPIQLGGCGNRGDDLTAPEGN